MELRSGLDSLVIYTDCVSQANVGVRSETTI